MNLRYRLIQFIADPLRGEGRNIAVIAHDGTRAYFKAIGMVQQGHVDLDYFKAIAGDAKEDAWVYGEWLNWFQTLTENEGRDPEELNRILDDLEVRSTHIVARGGGEIEDPHDGSLAATMNYLFDSLVGQPAKPKVDIFADQVEAAIASSNITRREDFERDVEVEFDSADREMSLILDFPFLLTKEPRTGFKVVRLRHKLIQNVIAQVNDALLTFEKSVEIGFLEKERCVVLCDEPTDQRSRFAKRLSGIAHLINVTNIGGQPGQLISNIVGTGRPA